MMSSICAAPVSPLFFRSAITFVEEMTVLLLLRRGKDQARIGRRILRFEILDRLEIAGVGDHFGEFLQLIELARFRFGFFVFGDGSTS